MPKKHKQPPRPTASAPIGSRYDQLFCRLVGLLDDIRHGGEDLLAVHSPGTAADDEQRVRQAVCNATKLTPRDWDVLSPVERECWLEEAIQVMRQPAESWSEAKAPAEWCKCLNMSPSTLRRRIADGTLIVDKVSGKRVRIRQDTLARFTG